MEIEIKVKIEKGEKLLALLKKEGTLQYEENQIDEYYMPSGKDFLSVDPIVEWMRLRDSKGVYSINYKHWHHGSDRTSNHCDEYETKVVDIEAMRNILKALNFKYLITVDKQRSAWNYNDYEISFDTVKDLGDFVEIEYKGSDQNVDPKKVTDEMLQFLTDNDCGEIMRDFRGYPYWLLEKAGFLSEKKK